MKTTRNQFIIIRLLLIAVLTSTLSLEAGTPLSAKDKGNCSPAKILKSDWVSEAISPVTNPIFFESPFVFNEIRPFFMQHQIGHDFITKGGDAQLYAMQLRWAINDRLALIAVKDGFISFSPKSVLGHEDGFADLALGLKYILVRNDAEQFILTPGFTLEVPTGSPAVFQGLSTGEWNVFASAVKGFGRFHLVANAGFRIPNDWTEKTAQAHYSLQADYYLCHWFIPFVSLNGFSVLSTANKIGLTNEGYDLINFGSTGAEGRSSLVFGGGARSKLTKNLDLGVAYEISATKPNDLFDKRLTVDASIHF
jgi:hypothetical protein